jgi:serine/threonine-protein kinase HipA
MGRPTQTQALSIWTNGMRVGTWRMGGRSGMSLQYDPDWMKSPLGRPLSLSLPFGMDNTPLKGPAVDNFFDNLLPDNDTIRRRLAARFKTATTDAFDLLRAIGRDCVGSVQLLGEDDAPLNVMCIEGTPMTDSEVEQHLLRVVNNPAAMGSQTDDNELRISLAGAQEKTALLWHQGQWMRPHGATPTTHILKLPLGLVGNQRVDLSSSVDNEWLCLALLREFGLPVAHANIQTFGSQHVLVVERFDRQLHASGQWWMRLPQEDFCQALGLSSHLKYEADGGPGMREISSVLMGSTQSAIDLRHFMKAQILFWLLAAPDGHAKNFSIQIMPQARFKLAPLYDVMSIWPIEGSAPNQWSIHKLKMAMAFWGKNKHYLHKDVQKHHLVSTAKLCGLQADVDSLIEEILAQAPQAMANVQAQLPHGFKATVLDKTLTGFQATLGRLG